MQGLPASQGASVGDVLDPAAIRNETLLGHHLVKVDGVELREAVLLGDVNLRGRETIQVRVGESPLSRHGNRLQTTF